MEAGDTTRAATTGEVQDLRREARAPKECVADLTLKNGLLQKKHELRILYAALIALGSDLTAADLARMTLDIAAGAVGEMMRRIEADGRLPAANRLVFDHFRTLAVTRLWGVGCRHRPT